MSPQDVQDKRVTVVGGARSGVAVARLLVEHGAEVFVSDAGKIEGSFASALEGVGVAYESNGHSDRALDADFLVVSPGVPTSAPLVQDMLHRGRAVYSEIEAASWFCRATLVAVTGSNGKTTTASLLGHVFRSAGRGTFVGGNIGTPFSDFAGSAGADDVVVLEVSSFQLDHIDGFRPDVSILLNITPDHLDRYDQDFEKYASSKFRICENQSGEDALVYNHDDPAVRERVDRAREAGALVNLLAFSLKTEVVPGAFVRDGEIVLQLNGEERLMRSEEVSLQGRHNLYNSLAAAVAARVTEVGSETVRESLASFEGVPHRLEFVRQVGGVRYVNDSKATNVNAVWYALESFDAPVVLIAGGRDKGNDYDALKPLLRARGRAVVAVGESAEKVAAELGGEVAHAVVAASYEEAVRYAQALAEPGDVVLLSPACASFDMFQDYEERGDVFRKLVNDL